MDTPLRLGEFVATLALAQDNAFGQPLESQLRSCLLATWICEAAGFDEEVRDTAYWVALLRYVGCTGHAHEVATVFGDEIAIRAQTLVHDAANPGRGDARRDRLRDGGPRPEERDEIVRMIQETAHEWAVYNFASGLRGRRHARPAARLRPRRARGAALHVRALERQRLSRPTPRGEAIPLPMRVVHLSHDMEAIGRLFSPDHALEAARDRRDRTYDPALADLFVEHGARLVRPARARSSRGTPCSPLEPEPHRTADGRRARRRPDRRRRLHRPQVAVHGRPQPPLRAARRRRRPGARAPRGGRHDAPPRGARARLRHHRRAELDLGQARPRSRARSSTASSCTRC